MFNKVLVPIDIQHENTSTRLCQVAAHMAKEFDSSLHFLTVIPGYGMPMVASFFPSDAAKRARQEVGAQLKRFIAAQMSAKFTSSVVEGKRAEIILSEARKRQSDLILLGCHKQGKVEQTVLGSCGTKVATQAPCSVLVVRGATTIS